MSQTQDTLNCKQLKTYNSKTPYIFKSQFDKLNTPLSQFCHTIKITNTIPKVISNILLFNLIIIIRSHEISSQLRQKTRTAFLRNRCPSQLDCGGPRTHHLLELQQDRLHLRRTSGKSSSQQKGNALQHYQDQDRASRYYNQTQRPVKTRKLKDQPDQGQYQQQHKDGVSQEVCSHHYRCDRPPFNYKTAFKLIYIFIEFHSDCYKLNKNSLSMGNAPHVSTWCIPTPEKRQTVYCYQSLHADDLQYSTISSSKVSLRRNKMSRKQNKQNVDDLHRKIDQLNRKLTSMKSELAAELAQKLKDSSQIQYGIDNRSVVISRYMNEGKETRNTIATNASRYGSSKYFGNSIISRYQNN